VLEVAVLTVSTMPITLERNEGTGPREGIGRAIAS
jgi:hypothetical protein